MFVSTGGPGGRERGSCDTFPLVDRREEPRGAGVDGRVGRLFRKAYIWGF